MKNTILRTENLSAFFGKEEVIKKVTVSFERNKVTAIMGPSGCGKTTLIRTINRMHELTAGATISGKIYLNDEDISSMNPILVRRKIGMVFQRPNPFPTMSIFENVIAGYKLNGISLSRDEQNAIVENSLRKAALWDEVKDILHRKGTFLSGGQQQRLCIARALAMKPDLILLDEPTSALDPKATASIEELIISLKDTVTILIVTHNTAQAARVSDYTAFMYLGELIEFDTTTKMFTVPDHKKTEEYLTGKFG
jgi:phosphate transport system ATP-binding protein